MSLPPKMCYSPAVVDVFVLLLLCLHSGPRPPSRPYVEVHTWSYSLLWPGDTKCCWCRWARRLWCAGATDESFLLTRDPFVSKISTSCFFSPLYARFHFTMLLLSSPGLTKQNAICFHILCNFLNWDGFFHSHFAKCMDRVPYAPIRLVQIHQFTKLLWFLARGVMSTCSQTIQPCSSALICDVWDDRWPRHLLTIRPDWTQRQCWDNSRANPVYIRGCSWLTSKRKLTGWHAAEQLEIRDLSPPQHPGSRCHTWQVDSAFTSLMLCAHGSQSWWMMSFYHAATDRIIIIIMSLYYYCLPYYVLAVLSALQSVLGWLSVVLINPNYYYY